MASLGNALVNKILGHSAAEKAFRPWWDNMEDFLVYGLVMLGLIVAPTAIINGTPLDCTYCIKDHCAGRFINETMESLQPSTEPPFNAWWVKKYCTMTAVDGFILYFPYILLIMALVIVLIERVFIRIFKAGLKLDMFYNLLVKETLEDEDLSKPIKAPNETVVDAVDGSGSSGDIYRDLENSKTAIEVAQTFQQSSNYFFSYFLRTFLEVIIAVLLLLWLIFTGFPSIRKDEFIYCDVHGFLYECAGHPQQFYMYVLFITIFLLCVYLLCCLYNILWMIIPQMGVLSSVMVKYKNELRKNSKEVIQSDAELLGELYDIYYKNRDLKLLLDLLAESSGIAPSVRIMALFDSEFRVKCEPAELRVSKYGDLAKVEFDDSFTMREILGKIKQVICIYTVEIQPPTNDSSVRAFKVGKRENLVKQRTLKVSADGDTELQNLNSNGEAQKYRVTEFRGLEADKEYKIRVSTIINGRTIAQRTHVIKQGSQFQDDAQ